MTTLEQRIQQLEDRQALQDLVTRYCTAVDSLADIEGVLDCFTDDAVFDLSGIGLLCCEGREQIRNFFTQVFADMTHHGHFNTNLAVDSLDGDRASCRAYVIGMGTSRDGNSVLVYVRYFLDCVRSAGGWKINKFGESSLMPLPESLNQIRSRN